MLPDCQNTNDYCKSDRHWVPRTECQGQEEFQVPGAKSRKNKLVSAILWLIDRIVGNSARLLGVFNGKLSFSLGRNNNNKSCNKMKRVVSFRAGQCFCADIFQILTQSLSFFLQIKHKLVLVLDTGVEVWTLKFCFFVASLTP